MSAAFNRFNEANYDEELTLAELVRTLPKVRGKRRHPSTLWRWARRGCKGANGTTIRLKHRRMGGTLITTRRNVDEFFFELAQADLEKFRAQDYPPKVVANTSQPSLRSAQIAQAKSILEKAGI